MINNTPPENLYFGGGASMDCIFSSASHRWLIVLGFGARSWVLFYYAPQAVPEQFTIHCLAWRGRSHQGVLLAWEGVPGLQQCLDGWYDVSCQHMCQIWPIIGTGLLKQWKKKKDSGSLSENFGINHLKTPLRREATSYLTHRLKSLPSSYSASLDCPISNLAWMLTRCTKHTYGKQHTWCVFMQWSPVTRESNQKLVTPLNHGCVPEPNTLTMVSATLVKQLTGWNPQGYCR